MEQAISRARISLRDYQRELAERLRHADSARRFQARRAGRRAELAHRPRRRRRGDAGARDHCSAAHARLVQGSGQRARQALQRGRFRRVPRQRRIERRRAGAPRSARRALPRAAALLVDRSLGLRNPASRRARAGIAGAAWLRAEYEDESARAGASSTSARWYATPHFLLQAPRRTKETHAPHRCFRSRLRRAPPGSSRTATTASTPTVLGQAAVFTGPRRSSASRCATASRPTSTT